VILRGAAFLAVLAAPLASPLVAEPLSVPAQADWAAAKRPLALVDGPTLAYVEAGDPMDPPVLLVHGYTDNSRAWSLLMPHLPGFRLIAIDLRGHGASEAPPCCYGLDTLAHDLLGALDALGIDRARVVGHSLGAMAAAVLAATAPERVERLVLISGALAADAGPGSWMWENIRALEPPLDPEGAFLGEWYWNPTPVDADFLARERAESAAVPGHVWQGVLKGLALADWSPLAPAITQPALILWGEEDGLFGAEDQELLRRALPGAAFERFERLGHNMFWEAPEAVGTILVDFLTP
jgi:pimeloyl-ACP methyl ester carboxylesterase